MTAVTTARPEPRDRRTIGMIGLGRMGLPLAQNLLERGFRVVGYRRSASPELVSAGGTLAASPAALAAESDVIISILPGPEDVEQVVSGPDGTLAGLRSGTVHIEMSTIDVERKLGVRDAVRARGGDLLDAPITGSPAMVAPRVAVPFVSGDAAAIDRVSEVLDALAGPWVRAGGFGNGAGLKYVSAMLMASHTAAAAEAIVYARRLGLDLELVQSVLDGSIAGSALLAQRGPVMRERSWTPAPGPVRTLHAILEQVEVSAGGVGLSASVFDSAKRLFDQAMADGWDDLDIASVHDQVDRADRIESRRHGNAEAVR